MSRLLTNAALLSVLCVSPAFSQVNESKEYRNVFHSPAAKSTPPIFRSVLQLEVVVQKDKGDPEIQYVNGVVVSEDGLIASVVSEPQADGEKDGGIQGASILFLDGSGAEAEFVTYDAAHGVAIFRAVGVDLPALRLSKAPLVARRRLAWHTVYKDGRRTYLYSRPLQVHKASHQIDETEDLCEVIDTGTSALSAERTGSALLSLDGSVVALMGKLKHWNVSPKNSKPRTKTAWAVPAKVIAQLLDEAAQAE